MDCISQLLWLNFLTVPTYPVCGYDLNINLPPKTCLHDYFGGNAGRVFILTPMGSRTLAKCQQIKTCCRAVIEDQARCRHLKYDSRKT